MKSIRLFKLIQIMTGVLHNFNFFRIEIKTENMIIQLIP